MNFNLNIKAVFFIIALAVTGLLPAASYSRENIDVVLVMDSSGSMKKTDPMSLRIQAAKLFISLLDKNDRAAVMSFSDKGYPVRFLTAVDSEGNKARLLRATDKISTRGAYTNLYDALSRGFEMLSAGGDAAGQAERSRVIVLMSDGMMDVGDPAEDRKLTDALNNDLLIKLKENNVKVYTIAFTEQSDRELLKNMAKQTGGFFNLALTDSEFHPIFTSIFEGLKSPEMLPVLANGFLVDRSVEEVTIVATKGSPDTKIQLDAPDGVSYSYKNKNDDIKWFVSNKFDMITVKNPAAGRWEILFSTGENNKAYIVTNLKLQTDFNQMYATFGKPMDISIWLEKEGERIKEQELLDKVYINIELANPGNEIAKMEPFERSEGVFRRRIAPFKEGDYRMKIVAKGMTFEREKVYVFSVAGIKEARQDIEAQRHEKEMKEQEEEVKKKEEAAAVVKDKPAVDKVKGGISWKQFIMWFFALNLVLGLIGFLYIMRKMLGKLLSPIKRLINLDRIKGLMKRKKDRPEAPQEAEAVAAPAPGEKEAEIKEADKAVQEKQEPEAVQQAVEKAEKPRQENVGMSKEDAEKQVREKLAHMKQKELEREGESPEMLKDVPGEDQKTGDEKEEVLEAASAAEDTAAQIEKGSADNVLAEDQGTGDIKEEVLNTAPAGNDAEAQVEKGPVNDVPEEKKKTEELKEKKQEVMLKQEEVDKEVEGKLEEVNELKEMEQAQEAASAELQIAEGPEKTEVQEEVKQEVTEDLAEEDMEKLFAAAVEEQKEAERAEKAGPGKAEPEQKTGSEEPAHEAKEQQKEKQDILSVAEAASRLFEDALKEQEEDGPNENSASETEVAGPEQPDAGLEGEDMEQLFEAALKEQKKAEQAQTEKNREVALDIEPVKGELNKKLKEVLGEIEDAGPGAPET